MFEDLQAIAGVVGGIGVMALAALYLIINRSPNGEGRRRRDAQEAIKRIDTKVDELGNHFIDHLRDHSNRPGP